MCLTASNTHFMGSKPISDFIAINGFKIGTDQVKLLNLDLVWYDMQNLKILTSNFKLLSNYTIYNIVYRKFLVGSMYLTLSLQVLPILINLEKKILWLKFNFKENSFLLLKFNKLFLMWVFDRSIFLSFYNASKSEY